METPQQRLERESREVEQALRGLFALPLDDGQLRQGMEELGKRWAFPRLLALWGPGLYFRNRVRPSRICVPGRSASSRPRASG